MVSSCDVNRSFNRGIGLLVCTDKVDREHVFYRFLGLKSMLDFLKKTLGNFKACSEVLLGWPPKANIGCLIPDHHVFRPKGVQQHDGVRSIRYGKQRAAIEGSIGVSGPPIEPELSLHGQQVGSDPYQPPSRPPKGREEVKPNTQDC